MKKKIVPFILAVTVAFSMIVSSCGIQLDNSNSDSNNDNNSKVTYSTYGSFWMRSQDCETMPVGAFNALPHQQSSYTYNYLTHKETVEAYSEAGINTLYGLYENASMKEVEKALDWCYDYNISYVLNIGGASNLTTSSSNLHNLDRVKYHDAFGGVMTSDEPGRISFEKLSTSMSVLDNYMDESVKGCLWHINLFPDYATQKQLYYRINSGDLPEEGYNYEKYVSDYLEIVNPKVLSYDYYPCRGDEGNFSSGYFGNMSLIRKYAMQKNIPFWVFVQTCSFGGNTRVPTNGDLLWQVNTALSYGAKGIQYFCGVNPLNSDSEKFKGSMFDYDGNKTEVYDYVKEAGIQIKAVDEVLMRSISKGLIINGDMPWGEISGIPKTDIIESYSKLLSVSANHAVTGCFDYNGRSAYYITNNSSIEDDTFEMAFTANVNGYYIKNGIKNTFDGKNISFNAKAGEGILVVI